MCTVQKLDETKSTLFIITGGTRGLGKQILRTFYDHIANENSLFIVIAKNKDNLTALKSEFNEAKNIITNVLNLEDDFNAIKNTVEAIIPENIVFDQVILVHNAATIGKCIRSSEFYHYDDFDYLQNYFHINLISLISLNSQIIKRINKLNVSQLIYIVNISSLMALQPIKGFSLYCAGKAARDLYFKTLALEYSTFDKNQSGTNLVGDTLNNNCQSPAIYVLNYAPGPLDTDMMSEVCANHYDPSTTALFKTMKESGELVPLQSTCQKLLYILEHGAFVSGDHIDFHDSLISKISELR